MAADRPESRPGLQCLTCLVVERYLAHLAALAPHTGESNVFWLWCGLGGQLDVGQGQTGKF
jgi:hypothetical protein